MADAKAGRPKKAAAERPDLASLGGLVAGVGGILTVGGDIGLICHRLGVSGSAGRYRLGLEPLEAGRRNRGKSPQDLGRLDRLGQVKLHDLSTPLDPQRKREGEYDLGARIETLSFGDRKLRAAQGPLKTAQQIVMADQAEVALLGESESNLAGGRHTERFNH